MEGLITLAQFLHFSVHLICIYDPLHLKGDKTAQIVQDLNRNQANVKCKKLLCP